MTAFTMPCCSGSSWRRWRTWCHWQGLFVAVLLLMLAQPPAYAGAVSRIEPKEAAIRFDEDAYVLAAEFAIELGDRFEEAVARGLPLYFKLELVIERPRKYWIAEHITTRVVDYKLTYSSLTRQYRIHNGVLQQNFSGLADALRVLGRVSRLTVGEKSLLTEGENYQATLRLALDRSQLPKPFQVDALTDRSWQIETEPLRWNFKP